MVTHRVIAKEYDGSEILCKEGFELECYRWLQSHWPYHPEWQDVYVEPATRKEDRFVEHVIY